MTEGCFNMPYKPHGGRLSFILFTSTRLWLKTTNNLSASLKTEFQLSNEPLYAKAYLGRLELFGYVIQYKY